MIRKNLHSRAELKFCEFYKHAFCDGRIIIVLYKIISGDLCETTSELGVVYGTKFLLPDNLRDLNAQEN